ncbi:hypothetical protein GGH93_002472 [Coemansia aciculifera]|nr:hypothetical protein GGH93_002472 [Coemansia aciculifera]
MASTNAIIDWATEYYCSVDDHEMVQELLRLQECHARDRDVGTESAITTSSDNSDNALPLHVIFHKLRRAIEELGPSYLGLDEEDGLLEEHQPWKSPLNLQRMADPTAAMSVDGSDDSPLSRTGRSLESFLLPANDSSSPAPPLRKRKRKAEMDTEPMDLPAVIHMLITVEQARRNYVAELTSRKHARGSVGEQSERWLHHHAKRSTAAEIKFENVLVALKELVILRTIIDPGMTQLSELNYCLSRTGSKRGKTSSAMSLDVSPVLDYDATQCLAILNLMFPLESLNAGSSNSARLSKWGRRYAFPLQHVPNPRAQLHQLLCEVEVWISTEGCAMSSGASLAGQSANNGEHTPNNCPGWLLSARGFVWGQLKQSCLTYLRDTQHKIATQHQLMNPWAPVAPNAGSPHEDDMMSQSMEDLEAAECISLSNDSGVADQGVAGPAATLENDIIMSAVSAQCSPDATTLERIVRHSRLVGSRFSQKSFYLGLL